MRHEETSLSKSPDSEDRRAIIAAVIEGLRDVAAGRTRFAEDASQELARKYKLHLSSDE